MAGGFRRMVVEKPFGRNLATARELNAALHRAFEEPQIYRIDHYLGKETVQNILVFRFANGIFEPIWNRRYIDHIQITVAETLGVEGRGSYYEETGALRDIIQNHVMQLAAIIGMEPPSNFEAETVRDEKVKLLRAIRPIHPEDALLHTVRGQYAAGTVDGEPVPGYREEPGVDPESLRETFVAMKLDVDNWRWAGTPFYLRTGKRLPSRATEIAVQFRHVPHSPFGGHRATPGGGTPPDAIDPNLLLLRIQPDEGISLRFGAKVPGQTMQHPQRQHGLLLRHQLPARLARRLRAAAARVHARRPHPLRPRGRGRGGLARLHRHPRRLAGASPRPGPLPELRRRQLGPRRGRRLHAPGRQGVAPPVRAVRRRAGLPDGEGAR